MTIGDIIVELRNERNISQQKVAVAIGVSQSTIAQIEKNRNEATASTIRKLANFFGVTTDFLLGLEDDFGARMATPMHDGSTPSYSSEERELIEKYRNLPGELKKLVRDQLEVYTSSNDLKATYKIKPNN